jgi:hypothetical protein
MRVELDRLDARTDLFQHRTQSEDSAPAVALEIRGGPQYSRPHDGAGFR